mmetsp:Transcript_44700/g.43307  ORF Transcript_44700/g.43307 Transcript_44700/m.43307 type:complete len:171 (+) Transcript_44700:528-1040(+)
MKKVKKYANENAEIILLGNKIDLINDIKVEEEKAQEWAEKFGLTYFQTCAKDSTNVDAAFKFLLNKIINNNKLTEKIKGERNKIGEGRNMKGLSSILLENSPEHVIGGYNKGRINQSKSKCCAIGLFNQKKPNEPRNFMIRNVQTNHEEHDVFRAFEKDKVPKIQIKRYE